MFILFWALELFASFFFKSLYKCFARLSFCVLFPIFCSTLRKCIVFCSTFMFPPKVLHGSFGVFFGCLSLFIAVKHFCRSSDSYYEQYAFCVMKPVDIAILFSYVVLYVPFLHILVIVFSHCVIIWFLCIIFMYTSNVMKSYIKCHWHCINVRVTQIYGRSGEEEIDRRQRSEKRDMAPEHNNGHQKAFILGQLSGRVSERKD